MTTPILEDRATILETRLGAVLPTLATKEDVARLEARFEDVTRLEARFDATVPTLATKEDVARLEARFDATVPTLATREDMARLEGRLEGRLDLLQERMDAMGNRLLLRFIGVTAGLLAAAAAVAFAIVSLV